MSWPAILTRRGFRSALRGVQQYVFGKRGQRRVHGWRFLYRLRMEVMLRSPRPIRGISGFSPAKLWVDREAFPRILKLLRRARHSVLVQMFIWKDDAIGRGVATALLEAADAGVTVDIFKEAVGDIFELHRDFLGTRHDTDALWKRFWSHPKIRITYETRNDHTKVFIIDDRILLLTGMNIADEYNEDWHDYLVELRGHRFVEQYLTAEAVGRTTADARLVMNSDKRRDIRPVVMELIGSAERSIVLEQSYVSDPAVLDALIRRSKDGVRVVLILPGRTDFHHYANMQSVARLLTEGDRRHISVFLYPRMVHGKIILVDRERAFLGSANLMTSSLDEMGEVNVLLGGSTQGAIRKLREVLRQDILMSTPISRAPRFRWLWKWLTWLQL